MAEGHKQIHRIEFRRVSNMRHQQLINIKSYKDAAPVTLKDAGRDFAFELPEEVCKAPEPAVKARHCGCERVLTQQFSQT